MMQVTVEKNSGEARKRSRARDSLIEATKKLLAHGALPNVTVDDILREADVARSSFYNHFTSVEALVTHTVSSVQNELYALIHIAMIGSPDAAHSLARGIVTTIRFGYEHRSSARVLMYTGPSMADPASPGNQQLSETLRTGVTQGVFRYPGIDVAVVCVLGICELGLSRMLDLHREYSLVRELTAGLCASVMRCVGVDEHRIAQIVQDAMTTSFDTPPESAVRVS